VCPSVWVDMFYLCPFYGRSIVSGLCMVIMWVAVGGGLIIVCRCVSGLKYITVDSVRLSEPVSR